MGGAPLFEKNWVSTTVIKVLYRSHKETSDVCLWYLTAEVDFRHCRLNKVFFNLSHKKSMSFQLISLTPYLSYRMTILPPTEKLKIVLQKICEFHKRFTQEFS